MDILHHFQVSFYEVIILKILRTYTFIGGQHETIYGATELSTLEADIKYERP